jgi:hypothetical protein
LFGTKEVEKWKEKWILLVYIVGKKPSKSKGNKQIMEY